MNARMVRVIAVLFLLYTGIEITVPQFCGEASEVLNISEAARENPGLFVISPSDNNDNGLPSEKPSADEDCFCCCAHVVPGRAQATIAVSDLMPSFTIPRNFDLPAPFLQGPFHPPRIA